MITIDNDLAERKTEATARLADLRRGAGLAVLEKKPHGPITDAIFDAEAELAAITAAQTETVCRQREAAAKEEAERIGRLRKRLAEVETARLDAIERAQKAANMLAEELREALAQGETVCTTLNHLGQRSNAEMPEFRKRLSNHVSAVLATVTGKLDRFGQIDLRQLPFTATVEQAGKRNWRETESKYWAIDQFTTKGIY